VGKPGPNQVSHEFFAQRVPIDVAPLLRSHDQGFSDELRDQGRDPRLIGLADASGFAIVVVGGAFFGEELGKRCVVRVRSSRGTLPSPPFLV
jgi:hypothetical protein